VLLGFFVDKNTKVVIKINFFMLICVRLIKKNTQNMDISEIFAKILTAPKITTASIAAMIVAGVIYLLGEKLGIVEDEELITTVIIATLSTFIIVLGVIAFLEMRKQDLELEKHKEKLEAMKNKGKNNSVVISGNDNAPVIQDVNNSTIQIGNQNTITKIEKQVNQHGDKSLYIEENKGNIKID
jgi:preprotein translocase subunit YajC